MINYKRAKDLYKILTGQAPAPQKKPQAAAMLRKAQINLITDQLRRDVLRLAAEGITQDPGLELPGYLVTYGGQYWYITNHEEKPVTADQAATLLLTEAKLTIYLLCVTGSDCTTPPELEGKQYETVKVKDAEAARQFIEDLK